MNLEQQHAILDKTYKDLTKFCGKPPRGNVRFSWTMLLLVNQISIFETSWETSVSKQDTDCGFVI